MPGRQTPVHIPAPVQTLVQAAPLTHVPVASQVCGTFPEQRIDWGAHIPEQRGVVVLQTNPHAAPSLTKWPVPSQMSGCNPSHRRAPGLQSEHTPLPMQAVQVVASRQVPVASHVCETLPMQRPEPGTQVPVHLPPEQRNGHAVPELPQRPVASQTCGCVRLHRVALGAQSTQAPVRHAFAHAAPLVHCPVGLQVCGTLPLQRVLPGVHTPVHAPVRQTN